MKRYITALFLVIYYITLCVNRTSAAPDPSRHDLYKPIPSEARKLVKKAGILAEHDRIEESILLLKRAIDLAPNYVNAHAEYIRIKACFMNRFDAVRAEYENLIDREPDNPVYPMALAIVPYQTWVASKSAWYRKVVEIAPEWPWAHYARSSLISDKEPQKAADELIQYVNQDGSWISAYYSLANLQEIKLKQIDDAIKTAEKMAAVSELRSEGLSLLWKLRLKKGKSSDEAKSRLQDELNKLISDSSDIKVLNAARLTYEKLLDDKTAADKVKNKIIAFDPSWYPERGEVRFLWGVNISGVPRLFTLVNKQCSLLKKLDDIPNDGEPAEKISQLKKVLAQRPNLLLRRFIYERILWAAEKAKDNKTLVRYGRALLPLDPTDAVLLSKMALALVYQNKNLLGALKYVRLADKMTRSFSPLTRPANNGSSDAEWEKEIFTSEQQQSHYRKVRSSVLDALGFLLCRTAKCDEGERRLRESIDLDRSEQNLTHLSDALSSLGNREEAEKYAAEAKMEYARRLRQSFVDEPSKEFELQTIGDQKISLSSLKGKVVLLDYWATWCKPCIKSIPLLKRLYEQYAKLGFEILYISTDDAADSPKIIPFARENKIEFPVLFDNKTNDLYRAWALPTVIFIDKNGRIRYRDMGFGDESPRKYETVIKELLKAEN